MKDSGRIFIVLLLISGGSLRGDTPWCDVEISPKNPIFSDTVTVVLSGWWPDSCIPNDSNAVVSGRSIYVDVIWDYPPGVGCWAVISEWESANTVGCLEPGIYTVYGRLTGDPYVTFPDTYQWLAEFLVSSSRFILSDSQLSVHEGGTETFTVALLSDPCAPVEVTVSRQSGDEDVVVDSGTTLAFDSSNYFQPQTVTVAALEDGDYFNGNAVIAVSAPNYVSTTLSVDEIDNDVPTVLYVDRRSTGQGDGRSWVDAFVNLQDALRTADVLGEVEEIRIAEGIYKPDSGEGISQGDRSATFRPVANVRVRGGYAGLGGASPHARDIGRYETILSGDLNGDDEPNFAHTDDNSKYVVKSEEKAFLDGLTITGGMGTGIRVWESEMIVVNCTIINNRANYGGGLRNFGGSVTLVNCVFAGNQAKPNRIGDGGGVYSDKRGRLKIINCTFVGNSANETGGGLSSYSPNTIVTNCIFWHNSDMDGTDESAQIYSSSTTVNYSCVEGWTGVRGGVGNFDADPAFVDSDGGDYHLKSQGGRWDANEGRWTTDEVTSPCIDGGDPMSPVGAEAFPNGGIVNMGAYGGTAEASKSYFGKAACETVMAGDVNGDCVIDFRDLQLMSLHWCEDNNP
ncbi:MAG: right-handed parallel beta-helix repeat-containing protein [Planctomycetota bacterium]|jgi:hypothetical protein